MKIGMLTGLWYIADGATVIESLQRAAGLGFRTVDLHGVFHAGPAHLSSQGRQAVKDELANLGLSARNYVLHPLVNLPSASQAELEHNYAYLCEGVDLALEWGVNQLMLNAGQWAYGVPRPQAWEQSVRFLQRLCDYAAPRGVFIAQEPEPYVWFLVNDLASARRMMADVDRPNFTLLLDLGHMALSEGRNTGRAG
jgi:sugar phosphate isomerase/epimerase